jgi:lysophospholipase L1-like esterase
MRSKLLLLLAFLAGTASYAQNPQPHFERKPTEPCFAKFQPVKAPGPSSLVLKRGDRLAICGDSITEQKMYSRLMEDYLTMCVPQFEISVRQYGWSGERAAGFLARMTNDCLRFQPTVATTCYGMNDHEYRTYEDRIGKTYREKSTAVVKAFKANRVRVIQGSPGCVGKVPGWIKTANGTVEDLNLNLCTLRNIGIGVAREEKVGFADVFWPMFTAGVEAQRRYGTNYAIAGKDGVHPDWAGQTVMAYAFLKALGVDGKIGTLIVDLKKNKMRSSAGHEVLSAEAGEFRIRSSRYPFCSCAKNGQSPAHYPVCGNDDVEKDNTIRSAMALVPFDQELNRFVLIARKGEAKRYTVVWGDAEKTFTAEELASGINLTEAFPCNPFTEAFTAVDAAVTAKQAFETRQIKDKFHGPDVKTDMQRVVGETEAERGPLVDAIQAAFVPVAHTIRIVPH